MNNEHRQIALLLLRQKFRDAFHMRNTKGDKIEIIEQYVIKQGDKVIVATKGHIVQQGLISLMNLLSNYGVYFGSSGQYIVGILGSNSSYWGNKGTYIRLGTGGNATVWNTSALTSINNTAPDSQSGNVTNPSNGVYKLNLVSTWNAGTLTAIVVTEIGLFLGEFDAYATLQSFGWTLQNSSTLTVALFSRISEADGDFTHFTVNIAVPLTITWTLTFQFA
jgi:hypothetical protein